MRTLQRFKPLIKIAIILGLSIVIAILAYRTHYGQQLITRLLPSWASPWIELPTDEPKTSDPDWVLGQPETSTLDTQTTRSPEQILQQRLEYYQQSKNELWGN